PKETHGMLAARIIFSETRDGMKRFSGKVSLVTGAARGIGRGIALQLAEEGAKVVINDYANMPEAHSLAEVINEMGRKTLVHSANIADRAAVNEMFDAIMAHFGQLDIAVANAATSVRENVVDADWEGVRTTLDVTQFGVFHTCQLAAQQMMKQPLVGESRGKIIVIGSVHADLPLAGSAAYNMAKAGITHLAETMAVELAPHHINVNVVHPGWTKTPGELQYYTEEQLQEAGKRIPWGRIGTPADIAQAVAFLASDAADYITGSSLRVDGGFVVGARLPE
ncbi:MAG: SDR family oxidoreductase, partial [Chloroflexota bacterium]